MNNRILKGFTLIELMIVVAIVAILAAIAYPAYTDQVRKTNRSEGQQFLLDVANRQQQYMLDFRGYAPDLTTLNIGEPERVTKNFTISIVPDKDCNDNVVTPGYCIVATPKAGTVMKALDDGFKLDHLGNKFDLSGNNKWK